jgi:pimeloyl-ACP methyl ester carboxylesterase
MLPTHEQPPATNKEDSVTLFRRVIRFFLTLLGLLAGLVVATAIFLVRQMLRPPRQPLWATPQDAGMDYENAEFPARDGLRLSGWFVPAETEGKRPAIVIVHGWPWNRLGEAADTLMANLSGATPVDLLRLAHRLHQEDYHVLMFDQRNHGQSAASDGVTFGLQESNDVLGALDYLAGRADVDQERIGAIGFSMGANTVLYAVPASERIKAAVLVQPTSPMVFAPRYAQDLLGPLGAPTLTLAKELYRQATHLPLGSIEPVMAAAGTGETPILYVQGKGDRWGSVSNVAHMVEKSPNAVEPLFVDTHHRFGGYQHVVNHPEVAVDFFERYL